MEEGGEVSFSGSSFTMHQSEAVVLTVQADREVIFASVLCTGTSKTTVGVGGTTQAATEGRTCSVCWRVGFAIQWDPTLVHSSPSQLD